MHQVPLETPSFTHTHPPNALIETIKKVWEILDDQEKSNTTLKCSHHISQFLEVFGTLEHPSYDYSDFFDRLLQPKEKKLACFYELIELHPVLKILWTDITLTLDHAIDHHILAERLMQMQTTKLTQFMNTRNLIPPTTYQLDQGGDISFLGQKSLPESLEIGWRFFESLDDESLQAVCQKFPQFLAVSMNCNDLGPLPNETIQIIFSHLTHARYLDLSLNMLYKLGPKEFSSMALGLDKIQYLNLSLNQIDTSCTQGVMEFFSHLHDLKALLLTNNDLGKMPLSTIQSLFSSLGNLRYLDLGYNLLFGATPQILHAIASSLPRLVTINLQNNYLGEMNQKQLKSFFEPLRHIQNIILNEEIPEEERKRLIDSIKQICPTAHFNF